MYPARDHRRPPAALEALDALVLKVGAAHTCGTQRTLPVLLRGVDQEAGHLFFHPKGKPHPGVWRKHDGLAGGDLRVVAYAHVRPVVKSPDETDLARAHRITVVVDDHAFETYQNPRWLGWHTRWKRRSMELPDCMGGETVLVGGPDDHVVGGVRLQVCHRSANRGTAVLFDDEWFILREKRRVAHVPRLTRRNRDVERDRDRCRHDEQHRVVGVGREDHSRDDALVVAPSTVAD